MRRRWLEGGRGEVGGVCGWVGRRAREERATGTAGSAKDGEERV